MLDSDFVRGWFPALATPWALFDNAGGSVPARGVIERATRYMATMQVQLGASYDLSRRAADAVAEGRRAAERLVGLEQLAPEEGSVVIGPSTSVLAQQLATALRATWQPGDQVIVTDLDHEANIGPWRALAATGIEVREWRMRTDTHRLELADLEPLLTARTRLVAFTHVSNIVGAIHDVPSITRRVREAGALSCVDGVAFAPHRRVDVGALGADFYLVSLYKVFGPHVGLMFGRTEALSNGKSRNHFFIGEDAVPYKYEPGGVCHELVASLAGITEYLEAFDAHHAVPEPTTDEDLGPTARIERAFERFAVHEEELVAPLLALLARRPRVRVLGEAAPSRARRVPTVAFTVEGVDSATIPAALDQRQLAVRFGHFYAYRAIDALGLHACNGVVRVSMLHTNTHAEVTRLVEALDEILPR
ncbi:MAG: aminotransferase class V-fold PLP-dependent enzyme [Planctomycetota bacterium]